MLTWGSAALHPRLYAVACLYDKPCQLESVLIACVQRLLAEALVRGVQQIVACLVALEPAAEPRSLHLVFPKPEQLLGP